MQIYQNSFQLAAEPRGFHLITADVVTNNPQISTIECGLMNLFICHTSASLTINENADPSVLTDLEDTMSRLVPEDLPFTHTLEGPDDMPAHVKSSLLGSSIMVPITQGRINLGTWQGIYLVEHRSRAGARRLIATFWGN